MDPLGANEDNAPFLERCFLFDAVEDSYDVDSISGEVPGWLRGTYYVNGPARFQRAGFGYKHWLDGDGMVCAVHFGERAVRFTNRFVMTPKLSEEEAAGRAIFRGFGTRFPGDRMKRGLMLESPANVSVYPYRGTLLAFGEQTLPYEIDPISLETRGEYDFNGSLTEVTPFAAHPKWDPTTGHMVNFGVSFSVSQPALNIYEFDRRGRQVLRRRHPLRMAHSNHDFGLTREYVVFFLSPLIMNYNRFWAENLSVMEALSWQPERGSRLFIAPRESKTDQPVEIDVGSGHCLHLINCFETGSGVLAVDVLEFETPVYSEYQPVPDLFQTITPCRPVRYLVHMPTRKLIGRNAMTYCLGPDFPSLDRRMLGRSYENFWMLGISTTGRPGRKFFDQLVRGNWIRGAVTDIYQVRPGEYLGGEPVFVANPRVPEDGVIISEFLDARNDRAEILLFEAFNLAKGPIARLSLKHKIHLGFHTSWREGK